MFQYCRLACYSVSWLGDSMRVACGSFPDTVHNDAMRGVLKFIGYALGALAGLSVLMLAALLLVSDETYKSWITGALSSATGRELTIAGDFKLDLGATSRLEAAGVSLANAEWGSRPYMFQAKRIEGELKLWPLLNGVLDLVLHTDASELVLETDASGRGNWEFGAPHAMGRVPPEPDDVGTGLRVITRDVSMTQAHVTFIQGDSGRTHRAELERVSGSG